MNWKAYSDELIKEMNYAQNQVLTSDRCVVIEDLWPAAFFHFLVLPKKEIDSLYELKTEDIPLLQHMHEMGLEAAETTGLPKKRFDLGYHQRPSQRRLHLHVVSKDYYSPHLGGKFRWNAFHTDFFMKTEVAIERLRTHGSIERLSQAQLTAWKNAPLKCNQCSYRAKSFFYLKTHLYQHAIQSSSLRVIAASPIFFTLLFIHPPLLPSSPSTDGRKLDNFQRSTHVFSEISASTMEWKPNSYELIKKIEATHYHVLSSEQCVVIQDLLPAASFHFLVLSRKDIESAYQLKTEDIPLLQHMHEKGLEAVKKAGLPTERFDLGYHLGPSQRRLHLHVVSKDYHSPHLRDKFRWNAFHTDFFLKTEDAIERLRTHGSIERLSQAQLTTWINAPLKCNQCSYRPKSFQDLKKHLQQHAEQSSL
ncbi:aprataxin-like protein [Anopheles aquasalis]|uniref:aprataxin-like protein n=1 Tax=Anopheles aquasalis TaxID=42839 RepID=UPI00215A16FC|nr:aprataxin-like protein [Anopheles aquasalis]